MILKAWVPNTDRDCAPVCSRTSISRSPSAKGAILIRSAVVFDREGTYVWRLRDEVAERVPIEIGLRKNGRVEVTLGLASGDTIVSAGTHKVVEGRKLRAAELVKNDEPAAGVRAAAPSGSERESPRSASRPVLATVMSLVIVLFGAISMARLTNRGCRRSTRRSCPSRPCFRALRRKSSRRRSPTSSKTR